MRRPTPLPPTGPDPDAEAGADRLRSPAPADEPSAREVLDPGSPAAGVPAATAGQEPDDHPTAPIVGLHRERPAQLTDIAGATAPPSDGRSAERDEPDERVSARDVWRAARARRRALSSEVRRFTARARRRRAIWLGSIAAVVLVAVGSIAAAYSPLFAVEQITVTGAEQLDPDAVADAVSSQLGTPLPLVDESAIKAALIGFPLVESYTVEARPPHELVVRVVERTPIGVIESAAGFTLVDAAGVALSTTQTPAAGRPILRIEGGTGSEAFTAVGQVLRSLPPAIMLQVTEASATTPNDVAIVLGGTGTRIVWGSAEDSAKKAISLAAAMQSRPPDTVSMYDVSSPAAVVIQ